jgi:hypothetical protein
MDKVFSHIINPTHNEAVLQLIETKILNGTNYTALYAYFKSILIKYKDPIIQFIYQFIKTYNDKDALIKTIKNFLIDKKYDILGEMHEKFKNENIRKEFITKIIFGKESENIIKEEILASEESINGFANLIKQGNILEIFLGFLVQNDNVTYIEEKMFQLFKILYDGGQMEELKFLSVVSKKILIRILWAESTSLYFAEKMIEKFTTLFIKKNDTNISEECFLTMKELF